MKNIKVEKSNLFAYLQKKVSMMKMLVLLNRLKILIKKKKMLFSAF